MLENKALERQNQMISYSLIKLTNGKMLHTAKYLCHMKGIEILPAIKKRKIPALLTHLYFINIEAVHLT